VLHAIDHLTRLISALGKHENAHRASQEPTLAGLNQRLQADGQALRSWLADETLPEVTARIEAASHWLAQARRDRRPQILKRTAGGELTPDAALEQIDAMNWLDRVGYHLWRIAHHLSQARTAEAAQDEAENAWRSEPPAGEHPGG
jgi:phosphate:Na+ symporter